MPRRFFLSILMTFALAGSARASITFSFDDGTFDGWTNIKIDPARKFQPTLMPGVSNPPDPGAVDGTPFAGRDNPHDTLLARSPSFYLDGSGPLTIYLAGGQGIGIFGQGTMPNSPSQLASNTSVNDGIHAMGVGVRRISDNTYIATAQRSSNGEDWQLVTIPEASLDAYAGLTQEYTLDVFDSFAGGWGWISFDKATIPGSLVPEPTSLTLLTLATIPMLARRPRRLIAPM